MRAAADGVLESGKARRATKGLDWLHQGPKTTRVGDTRKLARTADGSARPLEKNRSSRCLEKSFCGKTGPRPFAQTPHCLRWDFFFCAFQAAPLTGVEPTTCASCCGGTLRFSTACRVEQDACPQVPRDRTRHPNQDRFTLVLGLHGGTKKKKTTLPLAPNRKISTSRGTLLSLARAPLTSSPSFMQKSMPTLTWARDLFFR